VGIEHGLRDERSSMDSQRHMSPDGRRCLIVVAVDDDLVIGFEEYAPRTLLATSVMLVSVELIRLWSEVSKTAVPEGSAAPAV
jgi:hypothetical protein